jgi:membrane protease YdiL (CAAX protease family)
LPILAAGAIGYFACFRRSLKSSRRTLFWILAFATTGLLAVCGVALFSYWGNLPSSHSVFSFYAGHRTMSLRELENFFADLGPGLRFASAGFLLVAIFTILARAGRATLPLRLSSTHAQMTTGGSLGEEPWDVAVFVPMMIGLMPLLRMIEALVAMPLAFWRPALFTPRLTTWIIGLGTVVDALFLAAFVFVAMGREGREVFPRRLRLPKAKYPALAALLTVAVFQVWPLLSYVRDRVAWARTDWVSSYPPQFLNYFGLPRLEALLYLLPAFVEEIAWRGYLQPRFIRRYGLWRGVFLVGLVWGAFHFSSDFSSHMSDSQVFIAIARRLAWIVAFSYFLAWLTIRSESILPATIAHGVYNMFVLAALPARTPPWFLVPVLAVLGYALFHFWPPDSPREGASPDPLPETSAAT